MFQVEIYQHTEFMKKIYSTLRNDFKNEHTLCKIGRRLPMNVSRTFIRLCTSDLIHSLQFTLYISIIFCSKS